MENYGTLRIYIQVNTIHPAFGHVKKPKLIHQMHGLEQEEAQEALTKFQEMNPSLPIMHGQWQVQAVMLHPQHRVKNK